MESDTERIALGLREKDIAILETLVGQYQYRLVRYLVFLLADAMGWTTWCRRRGSASIAALAVPICVAYFASRSSRSVLASQGFLSSMPDALWFGFAFGVFTAAFFLALGYVYGDANRRGMPAWAWVIAAFLIPNLIGFVLYFVFRKPLLLPCSFCGKPVRGGEAFCNHCGGSLTFPPDASQTENRIPRRTA